MKTEYEEPLQKTGVELTAQDRAYVLAAYVHRYTGTHLPEWAKRPRTNGAPYKPQFKDDADWLANTKFRVRKNGRLDRRAHACFSSPTWPSGM